MDIVRYLTSKKKIFRQLEIVILELIENGYQYFGVGGALGFDTIAAKIILELRDKYKNIKLILVLPCLEQTKYWSESDVKIYNEIKNKADKVVYTSKSYTKGCMHKRNRYLVDNSSCCICYMAKKQGGTFYTVEYAGKNNLRIINLADLIK